MFNLLYTYKFNLQNNSRIPQSNHTDQIAQSITLLLSANCHALIPKYILCPSSFKYVLCPTSYRCLIP